MIHIKLSVNFLHAWKCKKFEDSFILSPTLEHDLVTATSHELTVRPEAGDPLLEEALPSTLLLNRGRPEQ